MWFKHPLAILHAALGEILSIFFSLLFYLFPDRKIDKSREGPGVLLVHGYLHNNSPWRWFRYALQKRAIGTVNSVNYPSMSSDIPEASHYLKNKIAFLEQNGQHVDVIIGHSEGGLVALEYALELAPKGHPITVITLGAPLRGTKLAKAPLGKATAQMQIDSPYLQSLKKRMLSAYHIRFIALYSTMDGVVLPQKNAFWPEFPHKAFDNLGHVQMLFSGKVVEACVDFLKERKG